MKTRKLKLIISLLIILFNSNLLNAQNWTELATVSGGTSAANDIDDGKLYFNAGNKFIVSNISNPSNLKELGNIHLDGLIRKIEVVGNYAYVVCTDSMGYFYVLDISNPATGIVEKSQLNLGFVPLDIFDESIVNLKVEGDYAYYLDGDDYLDIINISVPDNPIIETSFSFSEDTSLDGGLFINGDKMLIGSTDWSLERYNLNILDISDHDNIFVINQTEVNDIIEGIDVQDNYAYVVSGEFGLNCFDISNTTTPVLLDTSWYGGWYTDVEVDGDYAYVTLGNSGTIIVLDISNPENIPDQPLSQYYCTVDFSFITFTTKYGDNLYLSAGLSGLVILDVADSTYPHQVGQGTISSGGRATDMTFHDGLLYVADGGAGLSIVNIDEPTAPVVLKYVNMNSYTYTVKVVDDYAYVGHSKGMAIVDISIPENAKITGDYYRYTGASSVRGLDIKGDVAYLAFGGGAKVIVLDISDPANPIEITQFSTPGAPQDVKLIGNNDYLLVSDCSDGGGFSNNKAAFAVLDVSDPNPAVITQVDTLNLRAKNNKWNYTTSIAVKDTIAYIGDETGIYIISISDPTNLDSIGYWSNGTSNDVAISGNYLYAPKGNRTKILDISNPVNPISVGDIMAKDYSYGVEAFENLFFIADCDAGVHIYRNDLVTTDIYTDEINTPEKFALYQNYPNPFNPNTTIKFSLENMGNVKLSIFNMRGQLVQELINEHRYAGEYSISWNASTLSSGIYFYTLITGDFSQTKKCILLK